MLVCFWLPEHCDQGHPFFFEILNYFYRVLRKIKTIQIAGKWASVLATFFWNFWIHPRWAILKHVQVNKNNAWPTTKGTHLQIIQS